MRWLAELQRRNVIRMGGVYVVGAWLVVQVAETLLPIFHTPDWVLQALVVLLALGFVPALVFAWIFELTPQGLRRDSGAEASAPVGVDHAARRLDLIVILLLLATIGVVAWDRTRAPPVAAAPTEAAQEHPAALGPHSIAVLPFANFSPAPEDALFADGLADTLLHHLAQQRQLKVIARNSSFAYRDKEIDLRQVGRELGVASVLEGSVQRQGERVRVIAQLIETREGSHLWSQTYDRPLADLFAIQDEIAAAVLKALRVELLGDDAAPSSTGSSKPQVLAQFLQVRQQLETMRNAGLRDNAAVTAARDQLREILRQDPRFFDAWIELASVQDLLAFRAGRRLDRAEAIEQGYTALRQALLLQPDSPAALRSLIWLLSRDGRTVEALGLSLSLLERTPNDTGLMRLAGLTLLSLGRPAEALEWQRKARALDPRSSGGVRQIGLSLMALGRLDEARAHYREAVERIPKLFVLYEDSGELEALGAGRWDEGLRWFLRGLQATPDEPELLEQVAWLASALGLDATATAWAGRHAGRASASSSSLLSASLHLQADRAAPALEQLRASREEGDERWAADQRGLVAQLCWQIGDLECARSEVAAGLEEFASGIEGVDLFDGPDDLRRGARLGLVALRLGNTTRGERLLRSVLERLQGSPRGAVSRWRLPRDLGEAELLAALGEREAALAALESMLPDDGESVWLATIAETSPRQSPFFEALRGDPRFEKLMTEIERRRQKMAEQVESLLAQLERAAGGAP